MGSKNWYSECGMEKYSKVSLIILRRDPWHSPRLSLVAIPLHCSAEGWRHCYSLVAVWLCVMFWSEILARCSLDLTKFICLPSSRYSCSFSVCRFSLGVCLSSYKLTILVLLGCFLGIWSFLEVHYLFFQGLSYLLLISILSNFSSFTSFQLNSL